MTNSDGERRGSENDDEVDPGLEDSSAPPRTTGRGSRPRRSSLTPPAFLGPPMATSNNGKRRRPRRPNSETEKRGANEAKEGKGLSKGAAGSRPYRLASPALAAVACFGRWRRGRPRAFDRSTGAGGGSWGRWLLGQFGPRVERLISLSYSCLPSFET
jgi:hypothetical protein